MDKIVQIIFASPVVNLFIVAGLVFVGIAIVGNISGKIQPGRTGRIVSGVFGLILLGAGLAMYSTPTSTPSANAPASQADTGTMDTQQKESASSPVTNPPAPSGFRVVEAILRADPFDYTGTCPVVITFSGRISAVGGGRVSYKFLRNDGASAPVETLTFDAPGSKDVSTTWTLGGPGDAYAGWQAIQILEPQELTSAQATFAIQCQ
jgi:hypothetical protein